MQIFFLIIHCKIFFFTDMSLGKVMLSQLRFEYIKGESRHSLMGWKSDDINMPSHAFYTSSDAWFFHSKYNIPISQREKFKFSLGIPGCDINFITLMNRLRYIVIRDPFYIRIFHHHHSNVRNYKVCSYKTGTFGIAALLTAPYKCTLLRAYKGVELSPYQRDTLQKSTKD